MYISINKGKNVTLKLILKNRFKSVSKPNLSPLKNSEEMEVDVNHGWGQDSPFQKVTFWIHHPKKRPANTLRDHLT